MFYCKSKEATHANVINLFAWLTFKVTVWMTENKCIVKLLSSPWMSVMSITLYGLSMKSILLNFDRHENGKFVVCLLLRLSQPKLIRNCWKLLHRYIHLVSECPEVSVGLVIISVPENEQFPLQPPWRDWHLKWSEKWSGTTIRLAHIGTDKETWNVRA